MSNINTKNINSENITVVNLTVSYINGQPYSNSNKCCSGYIPCEDCDYSGPDICDCGNSCDYEPDICDCEVPCNKGGKE